MSCYLRISGKDFDVDSFIAKSEFKDWNAKDLQVTRKGEPEKYGQKLNEHSGFQIHVSDRDFEDFEKQQADAFAFLSKYRAPLKLLSLQVLGWRYLDFGMDGWPANGFTKSYLVSDELMKLCSELDIGIVISTYF